MQNQVRGTDCYGKSVPFIICQDVWEHFCVGAMTAWTIMQPDFISMATAFQLQVPVPQMHHHVMNHSYQHSTILHKTSSSCKNYLKEEEKQVQRQK